jgi:hypothetical protein
MASAPIIDSHCLFRVSAMPAAGRDHCGHCDRQVHNLDGMSSLQRRAFMDSCGAGKVCVAYTVHRSAQRRNMSLGMGLLATMAGSAAMAADQVAPPPATTMPAATETTTILTAEQIAKIPARPFEGTGSSPVGELDAPTMTAASYVIAGSVLDAGQARWADTADLEELDTSMLPEIGADDWLPSTTAP